MKKAYDLSEIKINSHEADISVPYQPAQARHDYAGKDNMNTLLTFAVNINASDLHITTGIPPVVRLHGKLWKIPDLVKGGSSNVRMETSCLFQSNPDIGENLTPEKINTMSQSLIKNEIHKRQLNLKKNADLAYSIPGVSRFRVNIFHQRGSVAVACRVLSSTVPEITSLFPYSRLVIDGLTTFAKLTRGLILVTGPTGSGKSTTLAAMTNHVNQNSEKHIITLEDPIEYLYRHGKSIINQRELGSDVDSFADGLRAALREDPDVILVGEMRDLETISTAITAAETGHLVLSTLHTNTAAETVERIIDVFPPHQQQQMRVQLASVLKGVISQQLLPRQDSGGRVCAVEIMAVNNAIKSTIREGKIHQIPSTIQMGSSEGMVIMDKSLADLVLHNLISQKEASEHSVDIKLLKQYLEAV